MVLTAVIPDGRIEDVPRVVFHANPDTIYGLMGHNESSSVFGRHVLDYPPIEMPLTVFGGLHYASVKMVSLPQSTLIFCVSRPEAFWYMLAQSSVPADRWVLGSKALVLPTKNHEDWGVDEEAFAQRDGRVLLFAGWANIKDWFQEEAVTVEPFAS